MESQNGKQAQAEKQILPEHDFYRYFGFIIVDVFTFFRRKVKWFKRTQRFLEDTTLPKYFNKTNEKIEKYLPIWKTLKTYFGGEICYHIYKMFYSMMRDPEFYNLPKYDRNMLLWSILLHDISKRGYPVIEGRDPIHPFQSAWQTLHYFNETFKIIELSAEDMTEWDNIFKQAYIKKNKDTYYQDHKVVPKVKAFLDKNLKDKDFVKELIYYIMLHQSTPTMQRFPRPTMLEPLETEVPKYFDKRMYGLFRILLIHDSFSYLIYSSQLRKAFGKEMEESIKSLKPYIKNKIC